MDLGLDLIFVWKFDELRGVLTANDPPAVSLPPGDGPRHFYFHPNGRWLYSLQEEGSTIVLFDYDAANGRLSPRQTISTLPAGFAGSNFCSEILVSADGAFVYAGNRLHDSIGVFSVGPNGDLTYVGEEWTRGDYPRSFTFDPTGQFLFCCNQRADHIAVFQVDRKTGALQFTGHYAPVGNPSSIVFLDLAKLRPAASAARSAKWPVPRRTPRVSLFFASWSDPTTFARRTEKAGNVGEETEFGHSIANFEELCGEYDETVGQLRSEGGRGNSIALMPFSSAFARGGGGHGGGGHGGGHGGHGGSGHHGGYHGGGYYHHGSYGGGFYSRLCCWPSYYGGGYGYGYGYPYSYGYSYPYYYSSGYYYPSTTAATQPASQPYLTNQTYEPGDGYRYPLYYDPATGTYFYYPVRR